MSSVTSTEGPAFRPWHFFVVLTLLAATAAVLSSRKVTPEHLVLLSVTVFAAGATGLCVYRTLMPFAGRDRRLSGDSLGGRARAALEREKALVLRSIKDLEFDRAMGKIAADDFDVVHARLRARALGLLQQLDADRAAPRERLERELAERLRREASGGGAPAAAASRVASSSASASTSASAAMSARVPAAPDVVSAALLCDACGVSNDVDARFCKACGTKLHAGKGVE